MFKEFKEFALKGSVVDLAVGVIIGGAFGKIITSLVDDIFNPILGLITGRVNFSNIFITLNGGHYATVAAAEAAGVPTLALGSFINDIISFLLIAIVVFIMVKQMNRLRKKDAPAPTTKRCPFCFSDIDLRAVKCPQCTADLSQ